MEAVEPSLVTRVHRFEIDDRAVMEPTGENGDDDSSVRAC